MTSCSSHLSSKQAFESDARGCGGEASRFIRRSFIKRSDTATVAAIAEWNLAATGAYGQEIHATASVRIVVCDAAPCRALLPIALLGIAIAVLSSCSKRDAAEGEQVTTPNAASGSASRHSESPQSPSDPSDLAALILGTETPEDVLALKDLIRESPEKFNVRDPEGGLNALIELCRKRFSTQPDLVYELGAMLPTSTARGNFFGNLPELREGFPVESIRFARRYLPESSAGIHQQALFHNLLDTDPESAIQVLEETGPGMTRSRFVETYIARLSSEDISRAIDVVLSLESQLEKSMAWDVIVKSPHFDLERDLTIDMIPELPPSVADHVLKLMEASQPEPNSPPD